MSQLFLFPPQLEYIWPLIWKYFESKQISNHNRFSNNHHFTDQLIVCTVSKLGHVPGFTSHRLSQGLRSVPFVSAGWELLVVSPLSCLVMDWWVCLVVSGIILQWERGSIGDFHGTNNFNSGTYLCLKIAENHQSMYCFWIFIVIPRMSLKYPEVQYMIWVSNTP